MSTPPKEVSAKKDRSPPFPFIGLRNAIERTVSFEEYFKRHPAPLDKVGPAWGMKPASSQAAQTLGAIRAYGLVEYDVLNGQRVAKLTEDARIYLRAQQDSIRKEILMRLALNPKPFAKYWERWGADRPPNPVCLDELTIVDIFTDSAARTFLRVYDETIAFAGLEDRNDDQEVAAERPVAHKDSRVVPQIGDWVQWDSGGQLQFAEPRRVRALTDDEQWLFVDGSETGVPVSEATVERTSIAGNGRSAPPILAEIPAQSASATSEREWLRGPLSKDTSYRLIVTGELTAKQIKKLIRLLEAQVEVLSDDDDI